MVSQPLHHIPLNWKKKTYQVRHVEACSQPTVGCGIFDLLIGTWILLLSLVSDETWRHPTARRGIFDPPEIGTLSLITSPILVPSVEAKQMDGGSLLFGNDLWYNPLDFIWELYNYPIPGNGISSPWHWTYAACWVLALWDGTNPLLGIGAFPLRRLVVLHLVCCPVYANMIIAPWWRFQPPRGDTLLVLKNTICKSIFM